MQRESEPTPLHGLIERDRVEGTVVYGADGQRIGTISRLAIEKISGKVAYAVMSFGGFFGIAADVRTIPWSKLAYDAGCGGYRTDITESELRDAPGYFGDANSDWPDREQEKETYDFYRVRHYWGV